jgi:hypothetical protein
MQKSKIVKLTAFSQEDGLHIIIPKSVSRSIIGDNSTSIEVSVYGFSANGVIQLSSKRVDASIPPLVLEESEFVRNE